MWYACDQLQLSKRNKILRNLGEKKFFSVELAITNQIIFLVDQNCNTFAVFLLFCLLKVGQWHWAKVTHVLIERKIHYKCIENVNFYLNFRKSMIYSLIFFSIQFLLYPIPVKYHTLYTHIDKFIQMTELSCDNIYFKLIYFQVPWPSSIQFNWIEVKRESFDGICLFHCQCLVSLSH